MTDKKAKILVFSGSIRDNSLNSKLSKACASKLTSVGALATLVDLRDYPADIYNADIESSKGIPDSMIKFKRLLSSNDGFMIASPEYNGFLSPLLVNTLVWCSRSLEGEGTLATFKNKYAAIMSASPGRLGGVRCIIRLRDFLSELGVIVVPGFVTVPGAFKAFAEDGSFVDEKNASMLQALAGRLVDEVKKN